MLLVVVVVVPHVVLVVVLVVCYIPRTFRYRVQNRFLLLMVVEGVKLGVQEISLQYNRVLIQHLVD